MNFEMMRTGVCPLGLEPLQQLDKISIKQTVELLEAFVGFETNNKYKIFNPQNQQIYYAFEETDMCMRLCCGPQRRFDIHILDTYKREVLNVHREYKCCAGCCWCAGCCDCCSHEVTVSTPSGDVMGYIKQSGSFWKVRFDILDASRNKVFGIIGPCCILDGACCPCDNSFEVVQLDGTAVGNVRKVYAGFAKEMFTTADSFVIEFPMDVAVQTKATLLGALFLIVGHSSAIVLL